MNNQEEYFYHYLTTLFKEDRPLKLGQLIHVFHGRRTPSMLYITEIQQLFSAFQILPKLSRDILEKYLRTLSDRNWLKKQADDGYLLTSEGKKASSIYFSHYPYPSSLRSLQHVKTRLPFWERFQLFSQIFSEMSYKNTRYAPVIKHPSHQESVRIWLSKMEKNRDAVRKQWVEETFWCMRQLKGDGANTLTWQLTGHDRTGQTRRQVARKLNLSSCGFLFYFEDTLEQLIQIIAQDHPPLLYSVLQMIQKETYYGLTQSAFRTAYELKKGQTIQQIASKRRLKENTIREHILEMAFIQPNFSYQPFIQNGKHKTLHTLFDEYPEISYREAKERIADLEFLSYRLVQLERMRQNEANSDD